VGDLPTAEQLRQALLLELPGAEPARWSVADLLRSSSPRPLGGTVLGLEREDAIGDGKWVRTHPLRLLSAYRS